MMFQPTVGFQEGIPLEVGDICMFQVGIPLEARDICIFQEGIPLEAGDICMFQEGVPLKAGDICIFQEGRSPILARLQEQNFSVTMSLRWHLGRLPTDQPWLFSSPAYLHNPAPGP